MIFASLHCVDRIKIQQSPLQYVLSIHPTIFLLSPLSADSSSEFSYQRGGEETLDCRGEKKIRKRMRLLDETRTFLDTTRGWWWSVKSGRRTRRRFRPITRDYTSVRSLCREDIGYPGIIYRCINCTRRPRRHAYGSRAGLRAFSCRSWMPGKKLSAFTAFRKAFTA